MYLRFGKSLLLLHNSKLLQPLLNLWEQVQGNDVLYGQLMEGDLHFMSRQAFSNSCNLKPPQNKKLHITSLMVSARLFLLFAVALILTLFLASGNATAEKLFQSPQSPPAQPPPEQPALEQPSPEQPALEQPQPPADQPVTDQTGIEQSSPVQPVNEAAPAPTLEPLAPVTTGDERDQIDESREQPPSNVDTPMVLDEAELIDTIFVSLAYVWLCCGVILLLLIPLGLLILYIRGRSKIVNEEGF